MSDQVQCREAKGHAAMWSIAGPFAAVFMLGLAIGGWWNAGTVEAVTSLADESFAACTVPLDNGTEGFFLLDFETGDLSGAVINPQTSQFGAAYKHNVLGDLGFKPGQAKNPRFLLVSGVAERRQANVPMASSLLYVTDSATGTTVVYGIPWNAQQGQSGPGMVSKLVPLDIAKPRGGGPGRPGR